MKHLCIKLLGIFILGMCLSCSEEQIVVGQQSEEQRGYDCCVYPLSGKATTRSLSAFETNWENQRNVTLNSGALANLPWYYSDANLPIQMAHDVKKEDGWVLILHTFSDKDITSDRGMNYMLLYNQRTSILKVLYYLEDLWLNNGGFWELTFSGVAHHFFNHTGELALPMNLNYPNYWNTSNATVAKDLAFRKGWNGFQVQLAYDTSNELAGTHLDITTRSANVLDVNLFGEFNGFSQGTLVTHGSTNPFTSLVNDVASVFGNEAGKYITDKFGENDSTQTRSVALAAGVGGAVVKWGANKILGALTAGFSKPTATVTDLSFTTRTKGDIKGTISFGGGAPSTNFRPKFSTTDLGCHLGAWNLAETPTVYVDPRAVIMPIDRGNDHYYRLRGITGYDYELVINPDLEKYIIESRVVIEPIRYWNKPDSVLQNPIKSFDYGSLGEAHAGVGFDDNSFNEQECIYEEKDRYNNSKLKIYNDDMKSAIYMRSGLYDHYGQRVPHTIFVPKETYYLAGNPKYNMGCRFLKISLYLTTEFDGKRETTIHTRTFASKVKWDPKLYDTYKDAPYTFISK